MANPSLFFAFEPTAFTVVRVVGAFDDGSYVMDGLPSARYLISAQTEKTFLTTIFSGEPVLNAGTIIPAV